MQWDMQLASEVLMPSLYKTYKMSPTFNNRQGTPLCFLPLRCEKPFVDLGNHTSQILGIWFHDGIKLYKLAWSEKHFSHAEAVLILCHPQCLQQCLADTKNINMIKNVNFKCHELMKIGFLMFWRYTYTQTILETHTVLRLNYVKLGSEILWQTFCFNWSYLKVY